MKDNLETAVAKFSPGLLLIPISIYLWAHTHFAMYGWFLAPLGAPVISMAHAYGLATIVRMLSFHYSAADAQVKEGRWTRACFSLIFFPLWWYGIGWIIVNWFGI